MKKLILLLLVLTSIMPISVFAKVDTLKLTKNGMDIIYDDNLFDKNKFMSHRDMIPAMKVEDNLKIKNQTGIDIDLTMKIPFEKVDGRKDLLNYLNYKIYLNDEIIYEGKLPDENYEIKLGKINNNIVWNLKIETTLSKEFSDLEEKEDLTFNVMFFADGKEIKLPNTHVDNINFDYLIFILIGIITGSLVFSSIKNKESDKK